jgi:hypothetical protein
MANISNVSTTSSTVTQTDATVAGATYDQTQAQTVVDLANSNKIELNKSIIDIGTLKDKINLILTELKASRVMV